MKSLNTFLARASRALRLRAGSLTVCLVTDGEIARWNGAYRGKRGPTDVLSFPAERTQKKERKHRTQRNSRSSKTPHAFSFASSGSSAAYLGDIAIAPAVARRNAKRFHRTFDD